MYDYVGGVVSVRPQGHVARVHNVSVDERRAGRGRNAGRTSRADLTASCISSYYAARPILNHPFLSGGVLPYKGRTFNESPCLIL